VVYEVSYKEGRRLSHTICQDLLTMHIPINAREWLCLYGDLHCVPVRQVQIVLSISKSNGLNPFWSTYALFSVWNAMYHHLNGNIRSNHVLSK
jgi:hypothetical protein